MARRQKKSLLSLLRGRGVTLAAVVMLSISAGGLALPKIFAATADDLVVSSLTATPSNNSSYNIAFNWSGRNLTGHWHVLIYKASTLISNANQEATSRTIIATCGVSYTVKVQAVGPNGGTSAYKQASATTRCPSAAWVSFSASGNNINSSWKSTSGFAQSYQYYLRTGSGNYVSSSTTATSRTVAGKCATGYSAYLIPYAGGQYGAATSVVTASTAACPAPVPAPAPAPKPSSPAPSGGSTNTGGSSSSSGAKKSSGGNSSHSSSGASAAPSTPGTPGNFSADLSGQKVVELQWDAAANTDHYVLRRSTDNATWQDLTTLNDTSYSDASASFSTTYFYQLQAVAADGQVSDNVVAQITTESFSASSNTISSPDKRVQVQIPGGAIDGNYSCSVSSSTKGLGSMPAGQRLVFGPYDLVCVTDTGDVVDSFTKPLKVTVKLADAAKGFKNITVRTMTDGNPWQAQAATYNAKTQQLNFSLANAKTFAAYGTKQKSILGTIVLFFLILLLVAGAFAAYWFWWRRRRTPEHVAAVQQQMTAEQEFRQALAQPDCTHLGMAQQVIPSSQGCYECEQQGTQWKALRICLICGHVGCSDDSQEQHAFKHFEQTGHPIIYGYADPNGNNIGWCYVDRTYI